MPKPSHHEDHPDARPPGIAALAREMRAVLRARVTRSIGLAVLASIIVVELAILVPSVADRRRDLVEDIDERNRYAAQGALRAAPANPLEGLTGLPDLRGIVLRDETGRLIGSHGRVPIEPGSTHPRQVGDAIISRWALTAGGRQLTAVVRLEAGTVDSDLRMSGLRILGLVFLISAFVTLVTMAVVGERVLRPLARITTAVREARRTGRRDYVEPDQPGEFAELVAQYNATVSEQHAAEQRGERLYYQAMHDPLTGLPNRALLGDRLAQCLERARHYGESAAVVLIDLDRFKLFNDTHGHASGDNLLLTVAERLRAALPNADTIARLGGDEFAILQPRIDSGDACDRLIANIHAAIRAPLAIGAARAALSASIGVTMLPADGTDGDTLLVNADVAMYRAKHAGGDRACRFDEQMRDDMVRRLTLENALRDALDTGQFELHYQPILDLADDTVTSCEALVRWRHPDWGLVPPNHFLPVVEETGMIGELGQWVLQRALADLPRLRARHPALDRIAVNVAAGQLGAIDADDLVAHALAATGRSGDELVLEITESAILRSPEATVAGLERASNRGALIAIDDFGTGYSSLAQLQDLPGQILKIDRRFVKPLEGSRRAREVFRAVVSMGHSLGMQVVAEGIEGRDQLAIVRASGCDRAQGFLLGTPRPLAAVGIRARAPG